jgi:hypothetical protein
MKPSFISNRVAGSLFKSKLSITLFSALLCWSSNSYAVNPATALTSTGQDLNIEITSPNDGSTVDISMPLAVTGRVGLGPLPGGSSSSIVYVIDVSGSTSLGGNDCNSDGIIDDGDNFTPADAEVGTVLDCEVGGVMALNDSLGANASINVAVVAFGSRAEIAQDFITPPNSDGNSNGIADLDEVLMQLDQGGGVVSVGSSTDFSDALTAMTNAFQTRPANEQRVAYFLTDGLDGGSVVTQANNARDAGIRVETFSVGTSAAPCSGSALETIANTTGGSCTDVQDIDTLAAVIGGVGGVPPTGINRVDITLNGGGSAQVSVDNLGNWAHTFSAGSLAAGANVIEATVLADDGTSAIADITVNATVPADDDSDPVTPTDPADPTDPTDPADPVTPVDPTTPSNAPHPTCTAAAIDPDGDGWGWENEATCIVDNGTGGGMMPMGPMYCSDSSSDHDGDGWGWENDMSCLVQGSPFDLARSMPPHCTDAAEDPDGDGWGWENDATCIVPGSPAAQIVD